MILVNESKSVLVLSAQGFERLYIRKGETFSFDVRLYGVFEKSVKSLMGINSKIKLYTDEQWAKIKPVEKKIDLPPVEKEVEKEKVDDREKERKKAKGELDSAMKDLQGVPKDSHHKTKFAAEKRVARARKRLESLK